jgi:hypothetical protein
MSFADSVHAACCCYSHAMGRFPLGVESLKLQLCLSDAEVFHGGRCNSRAQLRCCVHTFLWLLHPLLDALHSAAIFCSSLLWFLFTAPSDPFFFCLLVRLNRATVQSCSAVSGHRMSIIYKMRRGLGKYNVCNSGLDRGRREGWSFD